MKDRAKRQKQADKGLNKLIFLIDKATQLHDRTKDTEIQKDLAFMVLKWDRKVNEIIECGVLSFGC